MQSLSSEHYEIRGQAASAISEATTAAGADVLLEPMLPTLLPPLLAVSSGAFFDGQQKCWCALAKLVAAAGKSMNSAEQESCAAALVAASAITKQGSQVQLEALVALTDATSVLDLGAEAAKARVCRVVIRVRVRAMVRPD